MLDTILDTVFGALTKEQRMLVMRMVWIGAVSGHVAWVCGWLGVLGIASPFARADVQVQVASIVMEIRAERADRLDNQIQTVRASQCRTAIDSAARQNYTERLNELYKQYYELTGREPHVPRCDET